MKSRPPQSAGTRKQVPRHILLEQKLLGTFEEEKTLNVFVMKLFSNVPDKVLFINCAVKTFLPFYKLPI